MEHKMISLKEYIEELNLMKVQYGAEEELYPYIYMLLREVGFTQKYSVRSVAGARSKDDADGTELIMGYAAFPDIAIFDKSFLRSEVENNDNESGEEEKEYNYDNEIDKLYCCIEAKIQETPLLNIKGKIQIMSGGAAVCIKPSRSARYRYYTVLDTNNEKYLGNEFEIIKREDGVQDTQIYKKVKTHNKEKKIYVWEYKDEGYIVDECSNMNEEIIIRTSDRQNELKIEIKSEKEWYLETSIKRPKTLEDILKQETFYISINKSYAIARIDSNKNINRALIGADSKATDYGELIGELLWYGRVIYTNGYQWKYLKVDNIKKSDEIVDIVELRKELYKECVVPNKKNVDKHKWCDVICKRNITFEVKEISLIDIDEKNTTEIEWEDFKATLRYISKDWNKKCKDTHKE